MYDQMSRNFITTRHNANKEYDFDDDYSGAGKLTGMPTETRIGEYILHSGDLELTNNALIKMMSQNTMNFVQ